MYSGAFVCWSSVRIARTDPAWRERILAWYSRSSAAPLANVEISARAHGTTSDVLDVKGASLPSGAIATAFAATWFFMSRAPRPHTQPSRSSPDHGLTLHADG